MGYLEILLIGIALSMDAFAVTISNSLCYPHLGWGKKILMPVFFGVFQGLMPLIGFFAGSFFSSILMKVAGPFTFVVLAVLGVKMIIEAVRALRAGDEGGEERKAYNLKLIVLQAVATAIDALAVGVSFASYPEFAILPAIGLIVLTTFAICCIGLAIGTVLGEKFGDRAQVVGGIVLIAIGIKALF